MLTITFSTSLKLPIHFISYFHTLCILFPILPYLQPLSLFSLPPSKVLEERLLHQQVENEAQRSRLQDLVAKLEAHISQQSRYAEQERWTLEQESARLKAQQMAFRKEQVCELHRLEENRESLQKSRELFLAEQQEMLGRCYEEQRALSIGREEVTQLKRKAEERDVLSRQISEQVLHYNHINVCILLLSL